MLTRLYIHNAEDPVRRGTDLNYLLRVRGSQLRRGFSFLVNQSGLRSLHSLFCLLELLLRPLVLRLSGIQLRLGGAAVCNQAGDTLYFNRSTLNLKLGSCNLAFRSAVLIPRLRLRILRYLRRRARLCHHNVQNGHSRGYGRPFSDENAPHFTLTRRIYDNHT